MPPALHERSAVCRSAFVPAQGTIQAIQPCVPLHINIEIQAHVSVANLRFRMRTGSFTFCTFFGRAISFPFLIFSFHGSKIPRVSVAKLTLFSATRNKYATKKYRKTMAIYEITDKIRKSLNAIYTVY